MKHQMGSIAADGAMKTVVVTADDVGTVRGCSGCVGGLLRRGPRRPRRQHLAHTPATPTPDIDIIYHECPTKLLSFRRRHIWGCAMPSHGGRCAALRENTPTVLAYAVVLIGHGHHVSRQGHTVATIDRSIDGAARMITRRCVTGELV